MINRSYIKKVILGGVVLLVVPLCVGCGNKDNDVTTTTTTTTTAKVEEKEVIDNFVVKYEGVDVTPGLDFDYNDIKKKAKISTVASCALFGKDHVYTYDDVEITASIDPETESEVIYSVYFINDKVSMSGGLKIGSTVDEMKKQLGEADDEFNGTYTYNGAQVFIKIQTKNNKISSIEYIMVTN